MHVPLSVFLLLIAPTLAAAGEPAKSKPRLDSLGDPLPHGALYRIGTMHLRLGSPASALACSRDGKLVAAANKDFLGIWETSTGREVGHFPGGGALGGHFLLFAPDGKTLACNRNDKLCLLDVVSGTVVKWLGECAVDAVFAPDGKSIVVLYGSYIRVCTICRWDLDADTASAEWQVQPRPVPAPMKFLMTRRLSPDGKHLAAVEPDPSDPDGGRWVIRLRDVVTGAEIRRWPVPANPAVNLAFSPDGQYLAARCSKWSIRVWESATGNERVQLAAETDRESGVWCDVVFSPDGASLLCDGLGGLSRWDWRTGKKLRDYPAIPGPVAILPGSKAMVVCGGWDEIRLLDVDSGKNLFPPPPRRVTWPGKHLAFSPDARLVAWSEDGAVVLGDAASGKELRRWQSFWYESPIAFSPDGKTLVSAGFDRVYIWDVANGRKLRELTGPGVAWRCFSLFFSSDGRRVAAETWVWDVASGERLDREKARGFAVVAPSCATSAATDFQAGLMRLVDVASGKTLAELPPFAYFTAPLEIRNHQNFGPLFSRDGRLLLASDKAGLYLWDVVAGKRATAVFPNDVLPHNLAFSPNGRLVAAMRLDGRIGLLSTATGMWVRMLGQGAMLMSPPVFTPDGRTLIIAVDGQVQLWEVVSGREICRRDGHRDVALELPLPPISRAEMRYRIADRPQINEIIQQLVVSADSRLLATAGKDGTIVVWNLVHLAAEGPTAADKLDTLWADLAQADAARGRRAIEKLIAAQALPLLHQRLKPADGKLARWIADLDSAVFDQRQQALQELERMGELAEPALLHARARPPSLEARRRIEQILDNLDTTTRLTGELLRAVRAVQVLEGIGNADAMRFLQELAGGSARACLTDEAAAALSRLKQRTP